MFQIKKQAVIGIESSGPNDIKSMIVSALKSLISASLLITLGRYQIKPKSNAIFPPSIPSDLCHSLSSICDLVVYLLTTPLIFLEDPPLIGPWTMQTNHSPYTTSIKQCSEPNYTSQSSRSVMWKTMHRGNLAVKRVRNHWEAYMCASRFSSWKWDHRSGSCSCGSRQKRRRRRHL